MRCTCLAIRSDFADIFQVKSNQLLTRGDIDTKWQDGKLTVDYHSESFHRGLIITTDHASSPPHNANGRLLFDVVLEPRETWHLCLNYTAIADGKVLEPKTTCRTEHTTDAGQQRHDFLNQAMQMQSSNAHIADYYQQALVDIGALQIKVADNGKQFWMAAAGIPWFMAVFGREGEQTRWEVTDINGELQVDAKE